MARSNLIKVSNEMSVAVELIGHLEVNAGKHWVVIVTSGGSRLISPAMNNESVYAHRDRLLAEINEKRVGPDRTLLDRAVQDLAALDKGVEYTEDECFVAEYLYNIGAQTLNGDATVYGVTLQMVLQAIRTHRDLA